MYIHHWIAPSTILITASPAPPVRFLALVPKSSLCAQSDNFGTRFNNALGAWDDKTHNILIGIIQAIFYAGGEADAADELNKFKNLLGQLQLYDQNSPIVQPVQRIPDNVIADLAFAGGLTKIGAEGLAAEGTATVEAGLSNLTAGKSQGVNVVNSIAELNELSGRLMAGGRPVGGTTYPGKLVELTDGTTVGLRTASKSGGPTIDILLPDGTVRKVHVAQ